MIRCYDYLKHNNFCSNKKVIFIIKEMREN